MDPISSFFISLLGQPSLPYIGIITFTVFALLRGWVVPGKTVDGRIEDKDKQIESLGKERDDWKEAYQSGDLTRQELLQQNGKLLEAAETTKKLLESMRNLFERQRGSTDRPSNTSSGSNDPNADSQHQIGQ